MYVKEGVYVCICEGRGVWCICEGRCVCVWFVCVYISLIPRPLERSSGTHCITHAGLCSVNLTNFRLKLNIPLFHRVTIMFEFHKLQATSTTMAHSSCPCFSDCVSYALRKLQMTNITLKAEQHYSM